MKSIFVSLIVFCQAFAGCALAKDWVVYQGSEGAGKGKHIVLLSGDDEYRSEEALPMLGKILAVRHGFKCTVVFPVDSSGTIDPSMQTNLPGIEALDSADLCVMSLRFRELPDDKMKHFVDYLNAGKPIIALRTSTHAFSYDRNKQSRYAHFDWRHKSAPWVGGFGQHVLGETWVNHHGSHGKESTRGEVNEKLKDHPILRGVKEVWGPTDVYGVAHLPADAQVLMFGQVLSGMKPEDPPVEGVKNNPMMPLVWIRDYASETGKTSKTLTTTMGAAVDLKNEGLRRLLVNGCYWALGLEQKLPAGGADVSLVGTYEPTWFGFKTFKKGVKPEMHELNPGER